LSSSSYKKDDYPPAAVFANARQLLAAAPSFPSNMDASHEKINAAHKTVSRLIELDLRSLLAEEGLRE